MKGSASTRGAMFTGLAGLVVISSLVGVAHVGRVPGPSAALHTSPAPDASPALRRQEDNTPYDGRFKFVRVRYHEELRGWGRSREPFWHHDYPRAELHFTRILEELTNIRPYTEGGNILTLDDPELFKYPIAYVSEPGHWRPSEREVASLRAYLRKGGFIIFDDFSQRRNDEWGNLVQQMRRVLPDLYWVKLDTSDAIFHSFFDIDTLDYWHPYYRGLHAEWYGLFEDNDRTQRLVAVADYNNDIGEYWEWSGEGFFPIDLSNEAYKFGVNYIVYGMTH